MTDLFWRYVLFFSAVPFEIIWCCMHHGPPKTATANCSCFETTTAITNSEITTMTTTTATTITTITSLSASSNNTITTSTFTMSSTLPTNTASPVTTRQQACDVLNCNFDPGTTCHKAVDIETQWLLAAGQLGNRVTGIPGDPQNRANFARLFALDRVYAFIEGPASEAALLLPSVSLDLPKQLRFYYYKASAGSSLSLASNFSTLFHASTVDKNARQWQQTAVVIPAGQNQNVYFVADNLKLHQYIAVDNLQLLNIDGTPFCLTDMF